MTDPRDRIGSHDPPEQMTFINHGDPTPPIWIILPNGDRVDWTKMLETMTPEDRAAWFENMENSNPEDIETDENVR